VFSSSSRHGSDEWQKNSHYEVIIQVSSSGVCAATKIGLHPRTSVGFDSSIPPELHIHLQIILLLPKQQTV